MRYAFNMVIYLDDFFFHTDTESMCVCVCVLGSRPNRADASARTHEYWIENASLASDAKTHTHTTQMHNEKIDVCNPDVLNRCRGD